MTMILQKANPVQLTGISQAPAKIPGTARPDPQRVDKRSTALPELPPFNLASAQQYAEAGRLYDWIHTYLNCGEWANRALSNGLKLRQRLWVGPVKVALNELSRICGPERDMEVRVTTIGWERYIAAMTYTALEDFPPLLVNYDDCGCMSIRDGNHRYELFARRHLPYCYAFIWFDSPEALYHSRFADSNVFIT